MNGMNEADLSNAQQETEARERFAADLQALSDHAQELLQATSTVSGESIAAAREQLQESLNLAGEHLTRLQNEAAERGRRVAEQADSYVHENPWQSIAIGMVAGLALGLAGSSMVRNRSHTG